MTAQTIDSAPKPPARGKIARNFPWILIAFSIAAVAFFVRTMFSTYDTMSELAAATPEPSATAAYPSSVEGSGASFSSVFFGSPGGITALVLVLLGIIFPGIVIFRLFRSQKMSAISIAALVVVYAIAALFFYSWVAGSSRVSDFADTSTSLTAWAQERYGVDIGSAMDEPRAGTPIDTPSGLVEFRKIRSTSGTDAYILVSSEGSDELPVVAG